MDLLSITSSQVGVALLALIGALMGWLVFGVHSLKVEFHGMKEALAVRVEAADKTHDRFDEAISAAHKRIDHLESRPTTGPHW